MRHYQKKKNKQEKERLFNQGANESEHRKPETEKDWVDEYESIIKRIERENKKNGRLNKVKVDEVNFIDDEPPAPPAPKSPPNILVIEDSDKEEPDPEEEFIRLKDNKIVGFLEPEEEVSFLE